MLLQVELLLPLVRVSLTCMSVDHLQLLQAEAIGEHRSKHAVIACTKQLLSANVHNVSSPDFLAPLLVFYVRHLLHMPAARFL